MTTSATPHVAIVNESADPRRGGAETSIREMAQQLAALRVRVTLVYSAAKNAQARTPAAGEIHEVALPERGASRAARAAHFIRAAEAHCRAARYDIVHAVSPLPRADVYQPRGGTYAETIARSNALADRSWTGPLHRLGRWFNRKQQYLRHVERDLLTSRPPPFVAAVSAYVARQVRAVSCIPADRIRVVFNGVNPPALDAPQNARTAVRGAHHIPPDAPLVLFLAHNFKLKGLRELLHAAARPAAPAWLLAVVGRDDPTPFRRLAQRLGITDRVRFVGHGPSADWFAAADALAHPTWYDPCSRVVLEAAACGLPVVTTCFNGAAEILADGRTGLVLSDPADATALAAAIATCLSPTLRAGAKSAAGEIATRVSMQRHARELLELYKQVLAGREAAAVALPRLASP